MRNWGNRSGIAIANIDWKGNVYPDKFSRFMKFGNLNNQSFINIWTGENSVLQEFIKRKTNLKGRCKKCKLLNVRNGNLRARAYNIYNDVWANDPACYLGDDEI
jgi:radical SAM protein with 4Fe4S-binding SPASM domain